MTKDDLKKLRTNLPKGSREIIAQRLGVSKGYVNLVLYGTRRNDNILIAATELISEHQNRLKEATQFIESL
ncbi:MAG TPA: hypothetical protein DCY35_06775 [Prolixibacteraceae bacterium]|nr:hypothetical protein [Prolixibacteraceae bacterium]